jgi:acetyl-CoA carboxylase biotin carboxyl carrier protein
MQVDTDLVRQLAEMLNHNDLSEIEVEDGERRIVVKRKLSAAYSVAAPAAPAPAPAAAPVAAAAPAPVEEVSPANHPGAVKSPMVGTVYLSGQPGSPAFVTIGGTVAAGDTLVIIEAMKVMNPITAPKGGIVRQILVQDAQPVEYDQPLVIIE